MGGNIKKLDSNKQLLFLGDIHGDWPELIYNIKSKNIFDIKIDENFIYLPKDAKIDKLKLTNVTDGYLCDALAFGDSKSMDNYFEIYNHYGFNMLPVSETAINLGPTM